LHYPSPFMPVDDRYAETHAGTRRRPRTTKNDADDAHHLFRDVRLRAGRAESLLVRLKSGRHGAASPRDVLCPAALSENEASRVATRRKNSLFPALLSVEDSAARERLDRYLTCLQHWAPKINLTAAETKAAAFEMLV